MTKYFGIRPNIYRAVFGLACITGVSFLIFASARTQNETSLALVLIIECSVLGFCILKRERKRLYYSVEFGSVGINPKSLFSKSELIPYKSFRRIGIAVSEKGGKEKYYIFFSPDEFDESNRCRTEQWKATGGRLAIKFDKKLYKHLLSVLPAKQKLFLDMDYRMFIQKGKRKKRSFSKAEISRMRFKQAKKMAAQMIRTKSKRSKNCHEGRGGRPPLPFLITGEYFDNKIIAFQRSPVFAHRVLPVLPHKY